jgi:hypothetical protein
VYNNVTLFLFPQRRKLWFLKWLLTYVRLAYMMGLSFLICRAESKPLLVHPRSHFHFLFRCQTSSRQLVSHAFPLSRNIYCLHAPLVQSHSLSCPQESSLPPSSPSFHCYFWMVIASLSCPPRLRSSDFGPEVRVTLNDFRSFILRWTDEICCYRTL